ncbi:hypothetical protein IM877_10890 [Rhodococcus sp. GG48]|nr:hypothetical protein [Rhodococcus sp. GG48]
MFEITWTGGKIADDPDEVAETLDYLLSVDAYLAAQESKDRIEATARESRPSADVDVDVVPVSHNVVPVPNGNQTGYLVTVIAQLKVEVDYHFELDDDYLEA